MRIYARKLMKGQTAGVFFRSLLPPFFALLGIAALTGGALCFVEGSGAYFGGAAKSILTRFPMASILLPWLLCLTGLVDLTLSFLLSFYGKAVVFFAADRNQTRPKSVLRMRCAVRYMYSRLYTGSRKLLWLLFFLSPSALLLRYVLTRGAERETLLPALSAACFFLFAAGLVFYTVGTARYYLTDYILYLNPLIPPREAVISSVRLTEGRLLYITRRKLSLLPWYLACVFLLPVPFVTVYAKFCRAALAERLFGEDKRVVGQPAVTFFIDGNSRFEPA